MPKEYEKLNYYYNKKNGFESYVYKKDDVGTTYELEVNAKIANSFAPREKHLIENLESLDKRKKSPEKESKESQCVGLYPVSGYTRSDGKEVSGYIRRCGAKHGRN